MAAISAAQPVQRALQDPGGGGAVHHIGAALAGQVQFVDQETLDRLHVLAVRQKAAAAAEKDAKKDKEIASAEIKELLRDADTKGADDERFRVSYSWCSGKKSLDTLALAADLKDFGRDIEEYQKEGNGYERLTVKLLGVEDDDDE